MDRSAAAAAASMLSNHPEGIDTVPFSELENVIDTMGMDMVLLNASAAGYHEALSTCAQVESIDAVVAIAYVHLLTMHPKFKRFAEATTSNLQYPVSHRMEAFEAVRDCTHLEMLHQKLEERVYAGVAGESARQAIDQLGVYMSPLASFRGTMMRHFRCFTFP